MLFASHLSVGAGIMLTTVPGCYEGLTTKALVIGPSHQPLFTLETVFNSPPWARVLISLPQLSEAERTGVHPHIWYTLYYSFINYRCVRCGWSRGGTECVWESEVNLVGLHLSFHLYRGCRAHTQHQAAWQAPPPSEPSCLSPFCILIRSSCSLFP